MKGILFKLHHDLFNYGPSLIYTLILYLYQFCLQGWIYWGGGGAGVHTSPSPGQVGCRGGAIFMIKQKNMRDIMKYTL